MTKEMLLKAALWSIPVLWGAAGVYAEVLGTSDKMEPVVEKLEVHEDLSGHPVDNQRLNDHTRVLVEIVTEQRGMREEQVDLAIDVSAICQATGANCR